VPQAEAPEKNAKPTVTRAPAQPCHSISLAELVRTS